MKSKFLKLAIIPALLIGIACSSQQRTAANANTTNTRAASYKDSIKKALEQADLKDVNVDEDKNKNVINLSGTLHSENAKLRAGEIAQAAAGNRVIANEISVQPLGTEFPARQINTNTDSPIEKNYKAALISKGLNKEHIRFQAKNGVLTLQGSVKTPYLCVPVGNPSAYNAPKAFHGCVSKGCLLFS
jgi:osmotically-inducible protein OsmY